MKKRTRIWIAAVIVAGVALESWAIYVLRPSAGRWRYEAIVKDEPAAHALYDQMIAALRNAGSLSYKCVYSSPGERAAHYLIWLKKRNYFRVEAINARGARTGTLVGDGNDLWVYWPGDCPHIDVEDTNIPREQWSRFYLTRHTPPGRHSIGHVVRELGRGMHMPFIDPSTFHGYTDSLQPYIDGIAARGTDKIRGQECDVIEVSIMNAERSWYLWLSRRDHLPRRAKQIIRGWWGNLIGVEEWLDVTVDAQVPQDKFVWSPPEGWRRWVEPDPADKLLKPGTEAPQFALRSMDGGKIKLSDFRNEIVWLYIWRSGCPVCREEMCHLQKLYEKYKDQGMVILGFTYSDNRGIVRALLRENGVTFPNIRDATRVAWKVLDRDYKGTGGVPLNYIIDREGKVVDAWYGYEEGHKRALTALKEAGLNVEEEGAGL